MSAPAPGWSDRWSFLWWFAGDLPRQLTLPGSALAIVGLGALARRGGRAAVATAGSGLLALLGNSVLLIMLLGFDFDDLRLAIFRPYPLICYGVAALWLAAGMQWLLDRAPDWTETRWPARSAGMSGANWATRGATALAAVIGAAMVVGSASANWRVNDRSRSDFVAWYADVIFDALPPDAVVFAYTDGTAGPLGYHHLVAGRRPDITLYNQQGLLFGNRLYDPFVSDEEKEKVLEEFVDSTDRAVFLTPDYNLYPAQRSYGIRGFLLEARKSGAADTAQLVRDAREEQRFLELLDRQPVDRWEQKQRNELLASYGHYLGLIALSDSPAVLGPMEALFERAQDCYTCLLGMADSLLDNSAAAHADRIAAWLARPKRCRTKRSARKNPPSSTSSWAAWSSSLAIPQLPLSGTAGHTPSIRTRRANPVQPSVGSEALPDGSRGGRHFPHCYHHYAVAVAGRKPDGAGRSRREAGRRDVFSAAVRHRPTAAGPEAVGRPAAAPGRRWSRGR